MTANHFKIATEWHQQQKDNLRKYLKQHQNSLEIECKMHQTISKINISINVKTTATQTRLHEFYVRLMDKSEGNFYFGILF